MVTPELARVRQRRNSIHTCKDNGAVEHRVKAARLDYASDASCASMCVRARQLKRLIYGSCAYGLHAWYRRPLTSSLSTETVGTTAESPNGDNDNEAPRNIVPFQNVVALVVKLKIRFITFLSLHDVPCAETRPLFDAHRNAIHTRRNERERERERRVSITLEQR